MNEQQPEQDGSTPEQFVTATSYPNPFNPQSTIRYKLLKPGKVTLSVYNAVGQKVQVYIIGHKDKGTHEFVFDASNLTSGLHIYRVDAGYTSATGKMLYMK